MSDLRKVVKGGSTRGWRGEWEWISLYQVPGKYGKWKNKQKTKTLSCYAQLWMKENGVSLWNNMY